MFLDQAARSISAASRRAVTVTFASSCGLENAYGQRGLLHGGSLLGREAGPRVVHSLSQESDNFRIKYSAMIALPCCFAWPNPTREDDCSLTVE